MIVDQATLLKRAIIQGVSERYERELAQSKVDVACSQDHLQKISQILGFDVQKLQRAKKRKSIAAALILAAALAIGSLTAYAYRDQIREMIVRVFEENILITFPGEQPPATISEYYEIGYMPEGYELIVEDISSFGVRYEWKNDAEQTITYDQLLINVDVLLNGEDGYTTVIEHRDLLIYCRQYDDLTCYIWNDGQYAINIGDRTGLPVEEIIKIIDSMTKKNNS